MRAIVLFASAACYSPTVPGNVPCGPGDACPRGFSCHLGQCVTEIPADAAIDAPSDRDEDGVIDLDDNCADVANANQHDEDGDQRGDVCDGCPHRAQNTFDDGDGDGVDDVCDPNPTTGGDSIWRFEPLDAMPSSVTLTGSGWSVSNDQLRQTDTAATVTLVVNGNHSQEVTLEIGGTVDGIAGTSRELKVVAGYTAITDFHSCCFDDTDGTSNFLLEIEDENGTGAGTIILASTSRTNRLDTGAFELRITADPTTDTVECRSLEGGQVVVDSTPAANTMPAGQVAVISNRVAYSLNYLIIYRR